MFVSSIKPHVVCIETDEKARNIIQERFDSLKLNYEVSFADTAEEGLRLLDTFIMNHAEIAFVIAAQNLSDANGEIILLKAYEKWPNSLRILLVDPKQSINFTIYEEARIFRSIRKPIDPSQIGTTLTEASQFYEQRQELAAKTKILNEIHRASLTLTGERSTQKLLHKLMRIVIDNADAISAHILLVRESDDSLCIEASGHSGSYQTEIRTIEVSDFSPVCPSIVDYVQQSSETIILNDALNEGIYSSHPFIRKNLCRSILCTPLIYQGKLFGLLYLDNPNKNGAFSKFDVELLRLISAPAAIAIQNSFLYTDLEQRISERTAEVIQQKIELEKQRDLIQEKNNDVMDSIRYAKRIQDAILPKINDVKKVFPEAFIYFKPKDIVSGDFYWYSRRLSKTIIAVADCTGHGIPGAFMTVMANTLMKQIIELEGIFKPNEILYHLNIRMRVALHQNEEGQSSKDGLDMAICQFDPSRNRLQFAGAGRNLVVIRNKEVIETKGDKFGVGGDQDEETRQYTNHILDLETNDMVYIFSDGYPDQIGEEINRKFLSKRFFNLLLEIHQKDVDHQKTLLDAELRYWRGEQEQTDDITVIGIRI